MQSRSSAFRGVCLGHLISSTSSESLKKDEDLFPSSRDEDKDSAREEDAELEAEERVVGRRFGVLHAGCRCCFNAEAVALAAKASGGEEEKVM